MARMYEFKRISVEEMCREYNKQNKKRELHNRRQDLTDCILLEAFEAWRKATAHNSKLFMAEMTEEELVEAEEEKADTAAA